MQVGSVVSALGFKRHRIPIDLVLRIGSILVLLRWVSVPFIGVLGLIAPPRWPILLVPLILAVSLYNGWASIALAGEDRGLALASLRTAACLDALMLFVVVMIYAGNPPGGSLYGFYAIILIDMAVYWDAVAVAVAVLVFPVALVVVEWMKSAFWGQVFSVPQVLLWSLVMLIVAIVVAVVFNILAGTLSLARAVVEPAVAVGGQAASIIRLSSREQEVLRLVADGYSNTMIASRLHLSESTVKGYVESLLNRLNARNRAEAVAAASRLNLL